MIKVEIKDGTVKIEKINGTVNKLVEEMAMILDSLIKTIAQESENSKEDVLKVILDKLIVWLNMEIINKEQEEE